MESTNLSAFLHLIRVGEGTADDLGYQRIYGGELFSDFSDHPRKEVTANGITSTAAGAYQFLSRTWDSLKLPDFSPAHQDEGACILIKRRNAFEDVLAGRIQQAISKCNKEWASLPGSPYGQPTLTLAKALEIYTTAGGTLVDSSIKVAAKVASAFLPGAFSAIAGVVPNLIDLFGGGSDVATRNSKAAQLVVDTAKQAINATNEQELIERIQADPTVITPIQEAVKSIWWELDSSGVESARKSNETYATTPFIKVPAFWISCMLLSMVYMLLVDFLFVHPTLYDGNLRTQIVTGILLIVSMVGAYWIGSSFSSQRKTELAAMKSNE